MPPIIYRHCCKSSDGVERTLTNTPQVVVRGRQQKRGLCERRVQLNSGNVRATERQFTEAWQSYIGSAPDTASTISPTVTRQLNAALRQYAPDDRSDAGSEASIESNDSDSVAVADYMFDPELSDDHAPDNTMDVLEAEPSVVDTGVRVLSPIEMDITDTDDEDESMSRPSRDRNIFVREIQPPRPRSLEHSTPTSTNPEPNHPELRNCLTCLTPLALTSFLPTPPSTPCSTSTPSTCTTCFTTHINTSTTSHALNAIPCPQLNCTHPFTYAQMQQHGPLALFHRYDTYINELAINQLDDLVECANPTCHYLWSTDRASHEEAWNACVECGRRTRVVCRVLWHDGESCEEYQERLRREREAREQMERGKRAAEEERSVETVAEVSKRCPGAGCGVPIQRNGGCDHMTCNRCGQQWCWRCRREWGLPHRCLSEGPKTDAGDDDGED